MQHKIKIIVALFLVLTGWMWQSSFASANLSMPLPMDKAFAYAVSFQDKTIFVNFRIVQGYYLYTNKLRITLSPQHVAKVHYPQGLFRYDATRGRFEAYSGFLSIPISFKTNLQAIQMKMTYQGCSQSGFCYPPTQVIMGVDPITKKVTMINDDKQTLSLSFLTDQYRIQSLLETSHFVIALFIFLGIGLLLSFTPCVLPMIPILVGIIVGHKHKIKTSRAFILSLSYVLGSAVTYAIVGIIAASLGKSLQVWLQQPWIIALSSGLFVLLALSLFGLYDLRLKASWQTTIVKLSHRQKSGHVIGVFVMGILSTLIVSPCVTAPLVGVLMYIAQTGDRLFGASTLFVMGIGMGIPLLFIGTSVGKWTPKGGVFGDLVKKVLGILMLGMAIWLLSRIFPHMIIMLLWGLLLIGVAIYFGVYLPKFMLQPRLGKVLGFLLGFSGILLIFAEVSSSSYLHTALPNSKHNMVNQEQSFIIIHNLDEFKQQLGIAKEKQQIVLLDFYADWCASCVTMDQQVFAHPNVQHVLSSYRLLRIDLSNQNEQDEKLLKYFNVIAPPTIIFFDVSGSEVSNKRIVGEVNANEFLERLNHLEKQVVLKNR